MSNMPNFQGRRYSGRKRGHGGKEDRGPSKHGGRAIQRRSPGISNSFHKYTSRRADGDVVHYMGSPTRALPWQVRAKNRAANRVARASRKANRS